MGKPKLTDVDANGIPDWKENWFHRMVWGIFGFVAKKLPPHTMAHRAWRDADPHAQRILGGR